MSAPTTKTRRQTKTGRFYEIEGCGMLPSVTTILSCLGKPALISWAAKVEREMVIKAATDLYEDTAGTPKMTRPAYLLTLQNRIGKEKASQKELAKAGEIGTQVHALIEWSIKAELMYEAGPSPRICDAAQWAFFAYEDWRKSVNLKPILVEQVVYSKTHGYAGTLDLLAEVNGVLTVIDFKTGKSVYPESFLQNAAYRTALREMGHGDAKQGLILRLPKVDTDPEFEVANCPSEEESMRVFLNTIEVFKWSNANEEAYWAKREEVDAAKQESLSEA
jgi:hypothetical protein